MVYDANKHHLRWRPSYGEATHANLQGQLILPSLTSTASPQPLPNDDGLVMHGVIYCVSMCIYLFLTRSMVDFLSCRDYSSVRTVLEICVFVVMVAVFVNPHQRANFNLFHVEKSANSPDNAVVLESANNISQAEGHCNNDATKASTNNNNPGGEWN